MLHADGVGFDKQDFVAEPVGVQADEVAGRHCFASVLAINLVVAVVLAFDFDDEALAVFAADDKVGRVAMPFTVFAEVFDEEVGLVRVGDRAGEIDVLDVVRMLVQVREQLLEETELRVGIEVVGVVMEAKLPSAIFDASSHDTSSDSRPIG